MTAAAPELPTESGTPKKGVECGTCDDWGTIVLEAPAHEELCPRNCAAAGHVRNQQGREWS